MEVIKIKISRKSIQNIGIQDTLGTWQDSWTRLLQLGFRPDWAPSMAESKPEGPAGDLQKEKNVKLSQIKVEVKEHDKKHFCEEKTEKTKANKKFQKKVLQSGCLGTNDEPGVFAIVMMKI